MGSGDRGARRPPLRGGTHVSELRFHGPEKCRRVSVVRRAFGRRPPGTGAEAGARRSSGVGHPRRRPPRRRVREVPQPEELELTKAAVLDWLIEELEETM